MSTFETLNELLVRLFRDVMEIEQRALINQDFKDITNNDLHVIEAIGIGEAKNMSAIAKELSVTSRKSLTSSSFNVSKILNGFSFLFYPAGEK